MSYMFSNCTSLTELNLKSFDTSSVTTMKSMFESCIEIKSLDLTSFNTKKCKSFDDMFAKTKNIKVRTNSVTCSNMIENINNYVDIEIIN